MRVLQTGLPVFAFSVGFWPFHWVVLGRYVRHLGDLERNAIVSHEEGHIILRHAIARIRWLLSAPFQNSGWLSSRCRAQEFEADEWAVRHGHAEGLLRFLSRCTLSHENPLHPTPAARMANIVRLLHAAQ